MHRVVAYEHWPEGDSVQRCTGMVFGCCVLLQDADCLPSLFVVVALGIMLLSCGVVSTPKHALAQSTVLSFLAWGFCVVGVTWLGWCLLFARPSSRLDSLRLGHTAQWLYVACVAGTVNSAVP